MKRLTMNSIYDTYSDSEISSIINTTDEKTEHSGLVYTKEK